MKRSLDPNSMAGALMGFMSQEVNHIREYISFIDRHIEEHFEDRSSFHELQRRMRLETEQNLFLNHSGDMLKSFLVYDKSFRYSCVVAIYSILEFQLDFLCRNLSKISLGIEDIKGEGIHRYEVFISKAHQLPYPKKDARWAAINDLRIVRNFVAHRNGRLYGLSEKKIDRLRSIAGIDMRGYPIAFFVTEEFIDRSLRAIEDWYEDLVDGCFPQIQPFNPT